MAWLFDQGPWSITDDYRVIVAVGKFSESSPDGRSLQDYHGKLLRLPIDQTLWPSPIHLACTAKINSKVFFDGDVEIFNTKEKEEQRNPNRTYKALEGGNMLPKEETTICAETDYPVMFTVRDAVSGNGFLAGVTMSGRVIARKEDDGKWWIDGVRPAGITAVGNTAEEAFLRFRETYKNVLFDIAEDCKTFDDFKKGVESIYSQTNEVEEKCWDAAFRAIRNGKIKAEGFFSNLPKQAPEGRPTHCSVMRLDNQNQGRYHATDNVPDRFELPVAD